jgi:hypothetical protein
MRKCSHKGLCKYSFKFSSVHSTRVLPRPFEWMQSWIQIPMNLHHILRSLTRHCGLISINDFHLHCVGVRSLRNERTQAVSPPCFTGSSSILHTEAVDAQHVAHSNPDKRESDNVCVENDVLCCPGHNGRACVLEERRLHARSTCMFGPCASARPTSSGIALTVAKLEQGRWLHNCCGSQSEHHSTTIAACEVWNVCSTQPVGQEGPCVRVRGLRGVQHGDYSCMAEAAEFHVLVRQCRQSRP